MRFHRFVYIISFLLVILLFISCGQKIRERRAFKDCKFGLEDVDIKQVGLTSVEVDLKLVVANPNEAKAVLDRLDFKLYGNNEYIADGVHKEKTEVPPYGKVFLYLSVKARNKSVGKALLSALLKDELKVRFEGTAYMETFVGDIEYPLEFEKDIN
jgi:LEA14-like dessication related protein